jgi:UDP-N-acetylmuramoyl-tripeptide--D-alanyl-D-alanine ligase
VELPASEIARVCRGDLHGPDVVVDGASHDSRLLRPGQLFVPVVAERDGHEFIPSALEAGAAAYLSSRAPVGGTAILVDDTVAALSATARLARDRLTGSVVGITGSVGKTSVKDLLASVVAQEAPVAASEHSFNNELGVPLTLLGAPQKAAMVVVEMGARGPGHVAALCDLARPEVGVVTRVAPVHIETFGTLELIAHSKGELVEALPAHGTAVLNADDVQVAAMARRTAADVLRYGLVADHVDVSAEHVTVGEDLCPRFRLRTPWGDAPVHLAARGRHMVHNALAAACAALVHGTSLGAVVAGLESATLSGRRMELVRLPSGAQAIDDTYNANPTSVRAALMALAQLPARRRVAVLGRMAELGDDSERYHGEIGALARSLDIEVLSVASPAYGGRDVPDLAAAADALADLGAGDAVLLKASRVVGLDRLLEMLAR